MKLFKLTRKFRSDDDGAVTVDWVVLTAAVVGLCISAFAVVSSGTEDLTVEIANFMSGGGGL